ncbi:MAG: metalloregulator ArsR/SmtB family transcription factor [Melioribacteraceae bacterium]|nr:metalloregulator ArsR/SmtB family transcription factor [Melioribacteraceae bacterium]MCF8354073.1 metalloregulator ArsR/SmtB family transcription factor [Melioribacteraceae bacterium]MCF8393745.1 metalloregulator ArsR/SmtB family transcription factor [Melioribacteraceae bacterium]MCF8419489.1 metalloregulator ArsR/SmtB family transcription factor [Melioribacteraceae bacterium]
MNKTSNIFKSLSDPNRLRILKMLQISPLCVCEITEILGLSTSTVSQHLNILKKSGFIEEKRDGRWINYSINFHHDDERITAILTSLDFWIGDFEQLEIDREKIKTVDRHNILC